MATPSLNNDSPAILTFSALGAAICFSVAMTAIGSVGEISAPNNNSNYTLNEGQASQACRR